MKRSRPNRQMPIVVAAAVMAVLVAVGVTICRLSIIPLALLPANAPPAVRLLVTLATMMTGFFFIIVGTLTFYVALFKRRRNLDRQRQEELGSDKGVAHNRR